MIKITGNGKKVQSGIYIGRPSPLGNPYNTKPSSITNQKTVSLQESLKKYRVYLIKELINKESKSYKIIKTLIQRVKDNKDIQLNCWCCYKEYDMDNFIYQDNQCHGQIITEVIYDLINKTYELDIIEFGDKYEIKGQIPVFITPWIKTFQTKEGEYIIERNKTNDNIIIKLKYIIDLYKMIEI